MGLEKAQQEKTTVNSHPPAQSQEWHRMNVTSSFSCKHGAPSFSGKEEVRAKTGNSWALPEKGRNTRSSLPQGLKATENRPGQAQLNSLLAGCLPPPLAYRARFCCATLCSKFLITTDREGLKLKDSLEAHKAFPKPESPWSQQRSMFSETPGEPKYIFS